jgi:hypothetical protein
MSWFAPLTITSDGILNTDPAVGQTPLLVMPPTSSPAAGQQPESLPLSALDLSSSPVREIGLRRLRTTLNEHKVTALSEREGKKACSLQG